MAFKHLAVTCLLMFLGPMVVGSLPLALQVSAEWVTRLQLIGAGCMIGSALTVIVPEGFESFYSAASHATHDDNADILDTSVTLDILDPLRTTTTSRVHHPVHKHPSKLVPGITLLLGFLTMLLFEFIHDNYLGGGGDAHGHGALQTAQPSRAHTAHGRLPVMSGPAPRPAPHAGPSATSGQALFTALLIHSVADGFAVGAANMADSLSVAVAVGFAMVLHKGPVAFGLTTLLMKGFQRSVVARDLLVFALVSPIAAFVTFFVLRQFAGGAKTGPTTFIPICVLYSGGTFLYAACVKALPEVMDQSMTLPGMSLLVLGALLPLMSNFMDVH